MFWLSDGLCIRYISHLGRMCSDPVRHICRPPIGSTCRLLVLMTGYFVKVNPMLAEISFLNFLSFREFPCTSPIAEHRWRSAAYPRAYFSPLCLADSGLAVGR